MTQDAFAEALAEAKQEPFAGGGDAAPADGEVRIAIEKKPYADMIGHAISDPEVELCGVLTGHVRKDKYGIWLHVVDIIRGEKATQKGAQVTFTHDTWNHIHTEMDKHPDRKILGWYHTHGGFGIFLSEMDTFIHENFFTQPYHFAYVYDPLAGTEGFFFRRGREYRQATRYWIGGKPRNVFTRPPEKESAPSSGGSVDGAALAALARQLTGIQAALGQAREEKGLPTTIIAVALVALVLSMLLQSFSRQDVGRRERVVVKLVQDPASGLDLGVELIALPLAKLEVDRGQIVYQDRAGNSYWAAPVVPVTSAALLLEEKIAEARRQIDEKVSAPPPVPSSGPSRGVLVAVLLAVIGAFVAAGVLVKKRAGQERTP